MVMVLHTWGQRLLRHVHYHVLVPGGGISLETGQWVTFPERQFFLDPTVLMQTYRDLYLKKLRRRYRAGKLWLPPELGALADDEQAFRQWLAPLSAKPWVIHCGTREDTFRQDAAFRYLSHYVTGTAISDARILSDEDGQVTIRYKDYRDGSAENRNHAWRRVRATLRLAHSATALSATALTAAAWGHAARGGTPPRPDSLGRPRAARRFCEPSSYGQLRRVCSHGSVGSRRYGQ
ncbi:MAG: transposase [Pirellulaceae bacterium]